MFGNDEQGLPFWGGYSLGYYLVKWYLEKCKNISFEELTFVTFRIFYDVWDCWQHQHNWVKEISQMLLK
ncbi:DUF2268 domain-containing putative Zn-dependent protease [Heyndrickxia sp. NPDC080065]|uniref:DUF2268 domain-containing putative Zn-dependent protease n=1 Tax=Heyndrickxia sp. NPDC080065 TaxID=3390568 RepID=UPI003D08161C